MINAYGKEYDDKIEIAWEKFINDDNWDYSFIRPEIFESWKRSKKAGVDPFHPIEKILSKEGACNTDRIEQGADRDCTSVYGNALRGGWGRGILPFSFR